MLVRARMGRKPSSGKAESRNLYEFLTAPGEEMRSMLLMCAYEKPRYEDMREQYSSRSREWYTLPVFGILARAQGSDQILWRHGQQI